MGCKSMSYRKNKIEYHKVLKYRFEDLKYIVIRTNDNDIRI